MSDWVEVHTTNGHAVLMDREDWEALRPLMADGLRLQTIRTRDTLVVVLRQYSPPRTMLLVRTLCGPEVRYRNGNPLDCRRANLAPQGAAQTAAMTPIGPGAP